MNQFCLYDSMSEGVIEKNDWMIYRTFMNLDCSYFLKFFRLKKIEELRGKLSCVLLSKSLLVDVPILF